MLPTFVIGLREGLEAALIVGIIAAFLRKQGRRDLLRWVWLGVGVAVLLCVAIGVALDVLSQDLPQRQQEGLETVIGLLAVVMVTYMVVWMKRNSRNLKGRLEGLAADAMGGTSGAGRAMIAMAFLAVLREGVETVVFLLAAFQTSTSSGDAAIGAVLGIAVAVVLGYGIYRGGVRINLSRFFRVTGLVLVLVAAGILVNALHTAHEATWLNLGQGRTIDLTWLVDPGSVQASLLTGMLGLQSQPVVIEVVAWLAYLVPVGVYVAWPPGRSLARRTVARVLLATGTVLAATAAVLALLVPSAPAQRPQSAGAGVVSTSAGAVTVRDGARTVTLQLTGAATRNGVGVQVYSAERSGPGAGSLPARLSVARIAALNGGRLPIGLSAPSGTAPARYTDQTRMTVLIEPRTWRIVELRSSEQVGVSVLDPAGGAFALSRPIATSTSATPAREVHTASVAASADLATLQHRSVLVALAWTAGVLGGLVLLAGLTLALSGRTRPEEAEPARTPVSDLVKS